jgi:hypothetical protein
MGLGMATSLPALSPEGPMPPGVAERYGVVERPELEAVELQAFGGGRPSGWPADGAVARGYRPSCIIAAPSQSSQPCIMGPKLPPAPSSAAAI